MRACRSGCALLAAAAAAVFTIGCATHAELRREMVDDVRHGHYEDAHGALKSLRKDSSEKDVVMDLMDAGMILHLMGRYHESNMALDKAKLKLDELYGLKVSDELAAIAWNESSRHFEGEEFERIHIHMLMAFNFLNLGKFESAAVEARQINQRLQVFVDRLARHHVKTSYVQDPFAQFLAGLIQEAVGDENDAFRSFEDALAGYRKLQPVTGVKPPDALKAAVLRAALTLGHEEAVETYRPKFKRFKSSDPVFWKGKARLVVIAALGEAAHKKSKKWVIPDPQLDTIVVTYPVFSRGSFLAETAEVSLGEKTTGAAKAHDLSTLAVKMLDEKNAQVKGRAVAKALARYAAKKATRVVAEKSDKKAIKAAAFLANVALNVKDAVEKADTRSWMTLPDHYRLAVIPVRPGRRTVTVTFKGSGGVLDVQRFSLSFRANETRFLIARAREAGPDDADEPAMPIGAVSPNVACSGIPGSGFRVLGLISRSRP